MNSLDLFPELLWLLCSLTCSTIIFLPLKHIHIPRNHFDWFLKSSSLKSSFFCCLKISATVLSILQLDYWVFCCHSVVILCHSDIPLSPCSLGRTFSKHHHLFTAVDILGPSSSLQPRRCSLFSITWNYSLVLFPQGSSQVFHLHFSSPWFMPILICSVGDTHTPTPHCFVCSLFLCCLALYFKLPQVCWITFPEGSSLSYCPNYLSSFTAAVAYRQLSSSWNLN